MKKNITTAIPDVNTDTAIKNARKKRTFVKYSIVIMIGYAITQLGSLLAKELGMSSISYTEIFLIITSTVGLTLVVTIIVQLRKTLTDIFLRAVVLFQFILWLLLYMVWVYFLHEARILALFFAFMPLIFLATNSNLIQSMIISIAVTVIQLGTSYYGIYFAHQSGSFRDVVFYTSWFFPSALYIAYVAGLFHRKRSELKNAKRDAENARDALWGEMELAKKIQMVLLPRTPAINGYDISAFMEPADEVGGDYYDIINVAGRDWIVIGDVSGHGVPAGLVMMMVQTSIHQALDRDPDTSPSDLLVNINRIISQNIRKLGDDKYMTITVMAALENGKFYFSGLHQDIMVYRADTCTVEIIETNGVWIGLFDDITGMVSDEHFSINIGDVLMVFTDGITESTNEDKAQGTHQPGLGMYGDKKLMEIFQKNGDRPVEKIIESIHESLSGYSHPDDITLLILKRTV